MAKRSCLLLKSGLGGAMLVFNGKLGNRIVAPRINGASDERRS
jgi:hypothetical protein